MKHLIFEVNEFNYQLMKNIADQHQLKNIQKLTELHKTTTLTDDEYDSGFLEPWTQWVSIHTGRPSSEHKIKHLGDAPNNSHPQIWEQLSKKGKSVGVWGVMNGSRGQAENCAFFLPDPWTYSEPGYPREIQDLLDLPRYLSKNYLKISYSTVFKKLGPFISFFRLSYLFNKPVLTEVKNLAKGLWSYGLKHFVLISFFDFISVYVFFKYKKRYNTEYNFLFINSLAHVQHHYWSDEFQDRLVYSYKVFDRILGFVFNAIEPDEEMYILNGLSQKNTNDDPPWILYRQNSPNDFFKKLDLGIVHVEQLMTHDSHLLFDSAENAQKAFDILAKVRIQNAPLFFCEKDPVNPQKLFCRLDFYDPIADDTFVQIHNYGFKFLSEFTAIVRRTGKHVQRGDLLTMKTKLPERIYNHDLYHILNSHH